MAQFYWKFSISVITIIAQLWLINKKYMMSIIVNTIITIIMIIESLPIPNAHVLFASGMYHMKENI